MSAYPELSPCGECERPVRPKGKNKADYPFETISLGAGQPCFSCWKAARQPVPNPLVDRAYGATLRGYLRWLSGRQHRLNRRRVAQ